MRQNLPCGRLPQTLGFSGRTVRRRQVRLSPAFGVVYVDWALRVSNPRPPRCKRGALAAELSARKGTSRVASRPARQDSRALHREGAAAAAGALGRRVGDAEAAAVQLVVEVD